MLTSHNPTTCTAKLADFGLAEIIRSPSEGQSGSKAGTAGYLAPEILEGRTPGPPSDVWALGCLLYAMLSVSLPFPMQAHIGQSGASASSPSKRKVRVNYDFLDLEPIEQSGDLCKDLLTRMLVKKPDDRLTIEEVLQHPFFD